MQVNTLALPKTEEPERPDTWNLARGLVAGHFHAYDKEAP